MWNLRYRIPALALLAPFVVLRLVVSADQAAQPKAQTSQPTAPSPELQKLVDDYSAAWGKGDASALAALYTADALYIDSGNVLMKGRSEIETTFKQRFDGELKGTTITISPGDIRQLTQDVQVGEGAWQISGVAPPPGAATTQPRATGAAANAGRYLNTFVRQQERWLIASTAAVPEPPKVP